MKSSIKFTVEKSKKRATGTKPKASVERIKVDYKGKKVLARRLSVSTELSLPIEEAWANVKKPALLRFVAKGMIDFKPVEAPLPKVWEQGQTYAVKMRIFGFLPFGGTHYLFVEKIDNQTFEAATKEWDTRTKIWNHDIILRDLGNGRTHYEDVIVIYGGWLTGLITAFAKKFYKHRQKRWHLVAKEKVNF